MGLFLIAVSISIDALGIGIAYGVKNIKIPFSAKAIICAFTVLVTFISVSIGKWVSTFLSETASVIIGVTILIGMGLWIILQGRDTPKKKKSEESKTILDIFIKSIGISVKIIKNPVTGDRNNSKVIEPLEAVYLGAALCIDSLGAGFAGSVAGVGYWSIPISAAAFQMLFLCTGTAIGKKLRNAFQVNESVWKYICGAVLIFLGTLRLFTIF